MNSSSRAILIAFVIFIIWIFWWAVYAPKPETSSHLIKTIKEQGKKADLLFKEVTFEETVSGIKFWELFAQSAMVNKSTNLAALKEANGTFFKIGKAVLHFKSPAALWDMQKKEIALDHPLGYDTSLKDKIAALLAASKKSPLSVFNLPKLRQKNPGYWFRANNLSWRMADQKLFCTGGIILNKGEVTGLAEKLEGDVGLEKIVLAGYPAITISPNNSLPTTLEAKTLEVNRKTDAVYAKGAPQVTWGEAKIFADAIQYLQKEGLIKLDGNIRVAFRDITATGQHATYRLKDERVNLSGHAFAKQKENELSGEQVSVSLKEQKISVIGRGKVILGE